MVESHQPPHPLERVLWALGGLCLLTVALVRVQIDGDTFMDAATPRLVFLTAATPWGALQITAVVSFLALTGASLVLAVRPGLARLARMVGGLALVTLILGASRWGLHQTPAGPAFLAFGQIGPLELFSILAGFVVAAHLAPRLAPFGRWAGLALLAAWALAVWVPTWVLDAWQFPSGMGESVADQHFREAGEARPTHPATQMISPAAWALVPRANVVLVLWISMAVLGMLTGWRFVRGRSRLLAWIAFGVLGLVWGGSHLGSHEIHQAARPATEITHFGDWDIGAAAEFTLHTLVALAGLVCVATAALVRGSASKAAARTELAEPFGEDA